jgi:hypothetical protein
LQLTLVPALLLITTTLDVEPLATIPSLEMPPVKVAGD